MELTYRAEDITRTIAVADYIARYRDAERFAACCRACGNYNRSWCCPPFDFDVEQRLRGYENLLLIATVIIPDQQGLPLAESRTLLCPERLRLDRRLHLLEQQHQALAASYVGSCLYCPEGSCTRPSGGECRHPELVRPSLEAYGFDIGRTTSELFDLELRWGSEGRMPERFVLVCGLFHNAESIEW